MATAQQVVDALKAAGLSVTEQYPNVGWVVDAAGNQWGTVLASTTGGATVTIRLKEPLAAVFGIQPQQSPQLVIDFAHHSVMQG